jgi:hypothetical protein
MALHASVGLAGEDRQKRSFTMPAKATKLNKHGAAVQLGRELLVGSVVTVNNQRGIQALGPRSCAAGGTGGRFHVRNRVCRAGRTGGNLLGNYLPAEHLKRLTRKCGTGSQRHKGAKHHFCLD